IKRYLGSKIEIINKNDWKCIKAMKTQGSFHRLIFRYKNISSSRDFKIPITKGTILKSRYKLI
ncbi:hypothetical protein, partial [Staphylococcus condimenti]|uniref:hypothetical protein n=1 Tax=Staphylococcus condimenti TaxID=70255 RepID=UPI001A92D515